jgi:hypothetical protein
MRRNNTLGALLGEDDMYLLSDHTKVKKDGEMHRHSYTYRFSEITKPSHDSVTNRRGWVCTC